MTAYSFTGPSRLSDLERERVAPTVRDLDDPTRIVTGAARGWDMAVAFAAIDAWPRARHVIVRPLNAVYDTSGVEGWIRSATLRGVTWELLTASEPGYRARNEELVAVGDVLVAALRSRTFYRSGEWMTANIARRDGVPVQVVDL